MNTVQRLVVMDIDSTLIEQEVIDVLGQAAGVGSEVAAITERAMAGELDFAQALTARVALLKGLPESVFAATFAQLSFTEGALEFVAEVHRRSWRVGVVSGGFHEVADLIVRAAHVDFCLANTLEVRDNILTGRLASPVVTKEAKRAQLAAWAHELGLSLEQTVALGDGANDIPMIQAAGIGIAFCAKPAVRAAAPFAIDERNLMRALELIDALDRERIAR